MTELGWCWRISSSLASSCSKKGLVSHESLLPFSSPFPCSAALWKKSPGERKTLQSIPENQAQGQGFCCCYSLCFSFSEKGSICSPSPEMVRLQSGRALWCTLTNKMWWKWDFQDKALGGLAAFALSLFLPWDHQVLKAKTSLLEDKKSLGDRGQANNNNCQMFHWDHLVPPAPTKPPAGCCHLSEISRSTTQPSQARIANPRNDELINGFVLSHKLLGVVT